MIPKARTLALLTAIALQTTCTVDVKHDATEYSCAEDGLCPDGFECVENICVEPGEPNPGGSDAAIDGGAGLADARSEMSVPISASEEDAEEAVATGNVNLTSTDLEMTVVAAGPQIVALRFSNLDIGNGETITSASIQFHVDEVSVGDASLEIRTEANAKPSPFTAVVGDLSGRTSSATSVGWLPGPWETIGDAGAGQQTPELNELLQARVNDPEWRRGDSIVFLITGTGTRTAQAYDRDPDAAPRLILQLE